MEARGPSLLRLSLAQAMKLIVFCAAASACVAPMVHLWEAGAIKTTERLAFAVIFEAVAVPLVWALLSFILIRRGIWKDRLIAAFLLGSVSVALGFATYSFIFFTGIYRSPLGAPRSWRGLLGLVFHFAIVLALGAAFVFL